MEITEAIYPALPRGAITRSTVGVITTGGLLFIGYELATLNEKFYRDIVKNPSDRVQLTHILTGDAIASQNCGPGEGTRARH